jgi:hypothetical protein
MVAIIYHFMWFFMDACYLRALILLSQWISSFVIDELASIIYHFMWSFMDTRYREAYFILEDPSCRCRVLSFYVPMVQFFNKNALKYFVISKAVRTPFIC